MSTPAVPAIEPEKSTHLILWFQEIGIGDIPMVGGKNASLGEMTRHLKSKGVRIPDGFATTAYAYREFIRTARLEEPLKALLSRLDIQNLAQLQQAANRARILILETPFQPELRDAIVHAYEQLCVEFGENTDVAVRSSATAEDLPEASFAGQQETYLNVHGSPAVLDACHRCFASLFTDRAIYYREIHGFDHLTIALSVGVQKMVRSDLACSGVAFSIDTETGFENAVLINASYGLGENIVQGSVNPDEYIVFKPTLKAGYRPILNKRAGSKEFKLVYDSGGSKLTKNVPVPPADRAGYALGEAEILKLAEWACIIEDHYSDVRGVKTPIDMEWAKDGVSRDLFVVQARPETVQSRRPKATMRTWRLAETGALLVSGRSIGESIGAGKARVILEAQHISEFQNGEVLVTDKTDPDWEPIMKKAAAVVTNQGGRTCHAAIIARELGIPAIVGTLTGTAAIRTGEDVTVCCAEGEEGHVYQGILAFETKEIGIEDIPRTRTRIMMNLGNPDDAFNLAAIPNDGVGLARIEFIIANKIQAHPLALIQFDSIRDSAARAKISQLTAGYDNKPQYFIEKLAQGVGMIAAAFYPKPVIVRMSDFKTNEYANLAGGAAFEPKEENPMIGWRGASRYYDEKYREGFALECKAMKFVRDEMGLTNVILMIPFCRTPHEGVLVLEEMAKHGLQRGINGLEVYVMCEIPANVILAEEFSRVFDGFSIGSNDLTQLTLGLDRDSPLVSRLFDERDAAVKRLIASVIRTAKAEGRKIGICGQAPSDYPEFARFLVENGIDSISLNPDSVLTMRAVVAEAEHANA